MFTKEKRSEVMSHIKSKNTGLEVAARKMFAEHGIRYLQHPDIYGSPDFMLEGCLLLFCDSSFWHGRNWESLRERLSAGNNPDYWVKHIGDNRERDRKVNRELLKRGYPVVRFWDTDIKKRPEWCVERIRQELRRLQPDSDRETASNSSPPALSP